MASTGLSPAAQAKAEAARPPRWDPETRALLATALEIAAGAPLRQTNYTRSAGVPWTAVHRLRAGFEALGIDWRSVRANAKKEPR